MFLSTQKSIDVVHVQSHVCPFDRPSVRSFVRWNISLMKSLKICMRVYPSIVQCSFSGGARIKPWPHQLENYFFVDIYKTSNILVSFVSGILIYIEKMIGQTDEQSDRPLDIQHVFVTNYGHEKSLHFMSCHQ